LGWRGRGAQREDASYDPPNFGIDGNRAFGVQLAERDMDSPLVWSQLPQAVQRQAGAFADANTRSAHEQKGIGTQIIGPAQFLLQELVVLDRSLHQHASSCLTFSF
jgi:hypothetical protein